LIGVAVDLCRAIAIALSGPSGNAEMRFPDADVEFELLRDGSIDLAFVSAENDPRPSPHAACSDRLHRPNHRDRDFSGKTDGLCGTTRAFCR
jgi:hypothetical protein